MLTVVNHLVAFTVSKSSSPHVGLIHTVSSYESLLIKGGVAGFKIKSLSLRDQILSKNMTDGATAQMCQDPQPVLKFLHGRWKVLLLQVTILEVNKNRSIIITLVLKVHLTLGTPKWHHF